LFVADGLVWGGDPPGLNLRDRTAVRREGLDLLTGEVRRSIEVPQLFSPLHHVRCYRSKATDRFLMLTKRGVEFFDLQGDDHMRHDWLRAMCHYGFLPSSGLLYMPPHHCFCYPGVKLTGFMALAAEQTPPAPRGESAPRFGSEPSNAPDSRLEKGPAFGWVDDTAAATDQDWPTYRRDALRSGYARTKVSLDLNNLWQVSLGGRVTPPIVVGNRLYVSAVDAHRLACFDATSGQERWSFLTGGRVDSAPTFHAGLLLFGCRDGWVYCLRASDGMLAWRFRAAPDDRRLVAFEQLESPWPVPGSILMLDDVAYLCAGRSSFLDGGVYLFGLDPRTGDVLYRRHFESPNPDVQQETGRPFDMDGTRGDILVTDGKNIYLYQETFDKQLNLVTAPRSSTLGDRVAGRRLIATGGFLDDTWYDRTYWTYSHRWPGFYYANAAPKSGHILVFDEDTTYGLHVHTDRLRLSPAFTPGDEGYLLFADDNDNEPVLAPNSIDREKGPGFSRAAPPKWSHRIPLRARAMVLAGDRLFMAGPPDAMPEDDPYASFEGRLGARLWAVSAKDGATLAEHPLAELPRFDGLIAHQGRLYLSTENGNVLCFGSRP
jgi:outer membrane protein assembly factor BamB